MTDIAEIFTSPSIPHSSPEYATNSNSAAMGKEDFLTLLVAQLQNQDPMDPEDASEFTSQLTEFSSLEQLENLNSSMDKLAIAQSQSDRFGTMGLLGKDVTYTDGNFIFEGDPVSVGYQVDGQAASVTLSIQNESGQTVSILNPTDLKEGTHFLEWNGLDNEGNTLPEGKYSVVLEATAAGEDATVAVSPLVRSQVTGVDFGNETGDATIHTYAGAEINSNAILSIYDPKQPANYNKDEDSLDSNLEEAVISSVTETTEKSAPMDEEQIEQDRLLQFLAG